MPMRLLSLEEKGFAFVFAAALLAPAELDGLVAEAVTLQKPLTWPSVGKAALGSTSQPVGVAVGQAGTVNPEGDAA